MLEGPSVALSMWDVSGDKPSIYIDDALARLFQSIITRLTANQPIRC